MKSKQNARIVYSGKIMSDIKVTKKLDIPKNHPLYKWKKAQLLVELDRVTLHFPNEERTQVKVEGFNGTYIIAVDIKPGRTKCNCKAEHYSREGEYIECAHTLAAHKFLSEISNEKLQQLY